MNEDEKKLNNQEDNPEDYMGNYSNEPTSFLTFTSKSKEETDKMLKKQKNTLK